MARLLRLLPVVLVLAGLVMLGIGVYRDRDEREIPEARYVLRGYGHHLYFKADPDPTIAYVIGAGVLLLGVAGGLEARRQSQGPPSSGSVA